MSASLYLTARIRKSPFFDATIAAGATQFSVYNRTYLPGGYASPEQEFWSLVNDVALWDVTCQRVIEISGRDAARFADYLTPRDLSTLGMNGCRYVLLTDQHGGVLNDPVVMRLADDVYWFSCADSDVAMWMSGLLVNGDFDAQISEPPVATLQLQGPKSVSLLRDLLGEWITELAYYRLARCELRGIPLVVARTGWSAERGYELYLLDLAQGPALWRTLMEAGAAYQIAPGAPSRIRRIEAGILDYRVDMDTSTNPFELGLQRLVEPDTDRDFVGKAALLEIRRRGVTRRVVGLRVAGEPRLDQNLALAMLDTRVANSAPLRVDYGAGDRAATIVEIPFVDPHKRLARA